jgi:hypothetical protein
MGAARTAQSRLLSLLKKGAECESILMRVFSGQGCF